MNILQIQDQLKGLPDQTLTGYVQNPTGQVPTYLALSELQRRKTMREKYQQQQAPQTTVAEELAQEAQPPMQGVAALPQAQPMMQAMQPPPEMPMEQMAQGGLAELDVGDMYDENNFASGGIVAFDDGGEVEHFAEGGTSRLGDYINNIRSKNLAVGEINKQINALLSEKARLKYDFLTPLTAEQKAAQDRTIPQIDAMIAELEAKKSGASVAPAQAPTSTTGGPRVADTQLPSSFTGIDQSSQFNISPNALSQMSQPAAAINPAPAPAAVPAPAATNIAREGIGSLYTPLKDRSAEYDALQRNELTAAEDAMAKYKQLIGTDPMRPELEKKLSKMEERTAKMEEQAPWMALAKAGFEMASARPEFGKGQSAFADIARGASAGLKDYVDARDKLETLRDKQFDIQAKLGQAQRAEDIAAATHGLKSEEFIRAQNQANKLAKLSYQTNLEASNQKSKIDAYEAITKKQAVDVSNKSADIQGRYYDVLGEAAKKKTGAGGLDEDTVRRSYDSYLKGEFMDLPPGMTYDQFKLHTQGLAGVGLSPKAQSAYDKYKPK